MALLLAASMPSPSLQFCLSRQYASDALGNFSGKEGPCLCVGEEVGRGRSGQRREGI